MSNDPITGLSHLQTFDYRTGGRALYNSTSITGSSVVPAGLPSDL